MGHSLPKWTVRVTSAFPPIATELRTSPDVSNVPKGDVNPFNQFIGAQDNVRRNLKTSRDPIRTAQR
jgi:hypothetical protein